MGKHYHGDDLRRDRSVTGDIIDAIGTPLLVLRHDLSVVDANRSFCGAFQVKRPAIEGKPISLLGNGEWNTAELRQTLETVRPRLASAELGEPIRKRVEIGHRRLLLEARILPAGEGCEPMVLLAFDDLDGAPAVEAKLQALLDSKEILIKEMGHRIFNSLTIIGSFLSLKAQAAKHEETRCTLHEVHDRIVSVATVHRLLHAAAPSSQEIALAPYLSELCDNLSAAVLDSGPKVAIHVRVGDAMIDSAEALPIGLIVNELVTNAIKHAFPDRAKNCSVLVTRQATASGWVLRVSDNGIGQPADAPLDRQGLGTTIVTALARQLNADVKVTVHDGRTISVGYPATEAGQAFAFDSSAPAARSRRPRSRPDLSSRPALKPEHAQRSS
jgi:two-component sensor histidine kinase